jgi:hypothetical protein
VFVVLAPDPTRPREEYERARNNILATYCNVLSVEGWQNTESDTQLVSFHKSSRALLGRMSLFVYRGRFLSVDPSNTLHRIVQAIRDTAIVLALYFPALFALH